MQDENEKKYFEDKLKHSSHKVNLTEAQKSTLKAGLQNAFENLSLAEFYGVNQIHEELVKIKSDIMNTLMSLDQMSAE